MSTVLFLSDCTMLDLVTGDDHNWHQIVLLICHFLLWPGCMLKIRKSNVQICM